MIASVFIYGMLWCVAGQLDVPQPHSYRSTTPVLTPPPTVSRGSAASGTPVRGGSFAPPPTSGSVASGQFGLSGGSGREAAASSPTDSGHGTPVTFVPSTGGTGDVAAGGAVAGGAAAGGVVAGGVAAGGVVSRQPTASGYDVSPAGFSASSGLSGPSLATGSSAGTMGVAADAPRAGETRPNGSAIVPLATTLAAAAAVGPSERAAPAAGSAPAERGASAERGAAGGTGALAATLDDVTNFSDPAAWWRNLLQLVRQRGSELALNLAGAIVILIVGRWVARVSAKLLGRLAARTKCDTTLAKFASHLSYAVILALVVLSALHRVGIDTTSFTAVVAAAGLAVGLALQGSLANFAAGVLLIVFKPFKVGDMVLAGGSTGTIEEIQIFNTLIRTDNNAMVIVPNGSITAATITNFSAESTRRIDLTLRCSHDNNLLELKRFLQEVLAADDRVLQLPPPVVAIDQLADTGVHMVVQPWVRTEHFGSVRADLLEAIKLGFERHGFRMAGQPKPPPTVRRVAA